MRNDDRNRPDEVDDQTTDRDVTGVFLAGRTDTPLDEIAAETKEATLLGRAATLADVGDVAAFVASEQARTITATEVNISCGTIME